jgi:hypothetical protein
MKFTVSLVLLIIACVCFVVKAVGIPSRIDFMNLGFAFVTAAFIANQAGA